MRGTYMIIQWAAEAGGQWSRTCSLNYLSLSRSVSFARATFLLITGVYTRSSSSPDLPTVLLLCRVKARLGCWKAIYPLARYTTHPWPLFFLGCARVCTTSTYPHFVVARSGDDMMYVDIVGHIQHLDK